MYCLTFTECNEKRQFYYNKSVNAINMQRAMLITEITNAMNLLTSYSESYSNPKISLECDSYDNDNLQCIMKFLISMTHNIGDGDELYQIDIDVTEIICEDEKDC